METHAIEVPRTAAYHVLALPGAQDELAVVLHGYGQRAAAFLESVAALATPARVLVAPEALSRFYLRRGTGEVGASWMTRVERAAEIGDTLGYLDRLHARLVAHHGVPSGARVHALGFSQGGATAARWALLGAVPVARCTLWGCPLPPDLDLDALAGRARALAWTFVLGDDDQAIDRAAWEEGLARLERLGIRPEVRTFAGGHAIDAPTLDALARRPA